MVVGTGIGIGIGTVAAQNAPDCSTVSYSGDGTESNPYGVGNVDQLQCINEQGLSANYRQVSDIDASGTSSWNNGKGFEPIGEFNFTRDTEFIGTYDGRTHTITGLTIDRPSENAVGLFGRTSFVRGSAQRGEITSVVLEDVDITGQSNVGGLVGNSQGIGGVRESYATGDVSGAGGVGGLVGFNGVTVRDSYANASVSGDNEVGGLLGGNTAGGTVERSHATGSVSGNDNVGGLVGKNSDIVERSYATGNVTGEKNVGGLVGVHFGDEISDLSASGNVTGEKNVGGLVGRNSLGEEISDSSASGDVTGNITAGGLVGENEGAVTGSYATGNVVGNESIGGLAGKNNFGQVSDSSASGRVAGILRVGGLIGDNSATVRKSYANGNVSGGQDVGGLVGRSSGEILDSSASGRVAGVLRVGGLVGGNAETRSRDGVIEKSYATAYVRGSIFVGGLAGGNSGDITESYATGNVTGETPPNVGGLVGPGGIGGTVSKSYWDTETTGQDGSGGGTGLTTSEMTGAAATSNMTGFDFTSTWETVTNPDDYPVLAWQVQLFTQPLIDRFSAAPTNIPKANGGFDNELYEDLDGDGSGNDVDQTVAVFGELIRGNDLNGDAPDGGLTDEQARALNWNQGSPETEVTPADMVSLFGEQIRAD